MRNVRSRVAIQWSIAIIIFALCLSGCSVLDAYSHNDKGIEYMNNGEFDKAITEFEKAIESGLDEAIGYNNLCLVYNELGQFEMALKYIELAQELDSNDSVQYSNHGNTLLGLFKYEEALEKYDKAIELDDKNEYAFYGKAETYYQSYDYENAEKYYLSYLELVPDDIDAKIGVVNSLFYQNKLLKAYEYTNKIIEEHPDNFDAHDLKGYIMEYLESTEVVEEYYKSLVDKFPDNILAKLNIGIYYYEIESYHEAIAAFKDVYEEFPDNIDVNTWLATSYSMIGEVDEAISYAEHAIDIEPSIDSYNAMANILFDQTKFLEAITYYEKANKVSEYLDEMTSSNIAYSYFLAKRYQKCIDYSLSVVDELPFSYDIPMIMSYAYKEKSDYESAIKYLLIAIERGEEKSNVLYDLAENYYLLGDYDMSLKYINESLDNNLDDYDALSLKDIIELKQSGSENLVKSIVNDYYLYKNIDTNTKIDTSEFRDLSFEETEKLFNSLIKKDDQYSYYIYGDLYDYLIEDESNSIDFKSLDNDTILVNINFFNEKTDDLFIEFIDGISEPENKTLILNVMDNGGGVTDSAINMLDTLLPNVTVCTLIDRMGNTDSSYSSESMVEFKDIYVFINKNSASSSELLALGLDTYLDNVTIVGEQSHGKGVGQVFFEEPNKKSAYFVVNHYWNVRETNIMDVGITPDIIVKEPTFDLNLQAIGLK